MINLRIDNIMKIAFLSNYTVDLVCSNLKKMLAQNAIETEFYITGFNQYVQDILGKDSPLYQFKPDAVFLCIDLEIFCGDVFDLIYQQESENVKQGIWERWLHLKDQLCLLKSCLPETFVFVDNFFIPYKYRTGTLEYNSRFSLGEMVLELNMDLSRFQKELRGLKIVDVHSLLLQKGEETLFDNRLYYIAKSRWSQPGIQALSGLYAGYIMAF